MKCSTENCGHSYESLSASWRTSTTFATHILPSGHLLWSAKTLEAYKPEKKQVETAIIYDPCIPARTFWTSAGMAETQSQPVLTDYCTRELLASSECDSTSKWVLQEVLHEAFLRTLATRCAWLHIASKFCYTNYTNMDPCNL